MIQGFYKGGIPCRKGWYFLPAPTSFRFFYSRVFPYPPIKEYRVLTIGDLDRVLPGMLE